MKIIYDKKSFEVVSTTGTNMLFPLGVPDEMLDLAPNEKTFAIHDIDDVSLLDKVKDGYKLKVIEDSNDNPYDLEIFMTNDEYNSSIPKELILPTQEERLEALEMALLLLL